MSATMDPAPVAAYLGGCPVLDVPGLTHPLDVSYHPDTSLPAAVGALVGSTPGQVLCFLAGAAEIRRAAAEVAGIAGAIGDRDRSASRIARARRSGSRAGARLDSPDHSRDEHRRNVAHGPWRHGGRRHGHPQGRALRSRSGDRQPRAGTNLARLRRPARGPGGASRPRHRVAPVASGREASAAQRTRHSPDRSIGPAARRARVGRRSADAGLVRSARVRCACRRNGPASAARRTRRKRSDAARHAHAPPADPPAARTHSDRGRRHALRRARLCAAVGASLPASARRDDRLRSALRHRARARFAAPCPPRGRGPFGGVRL